MTISDFTCELVPGTVSRKGDRTTRYWVWKNQIHMGITPVKGADVATFRFYVGGFAKDKKSCYCVGRRLRAADPNTFRALNFAYATDGRSVWTLGGQLKDVDAASFVVCDSGALDLGQGVLAPYGYGKDKQRVYYYDFDGKPNWVRQARAETFVSTGDGVFGKDDLNVFCGGVVVPGAHVESWISFTSTYSKDRVAIYYGTRALREADYDTFEAVPSKHGEQIAKDKSHFYRNTDRVEKSQFLKMAANESCFQSYPVQANPARLAWNNGTVVKLAEAIYTDRAFDRLPILADALEDAGCTDPDILAHCRGPGPHVRGCWVVDLLTGRK